MLKGLFGKTEGQSYSFPANTEVEAYWQALKKDGALPRRNDLDPRGIRGALHNAFILNTDELHDARFRIVGSSIAALYQNDLRGMSILSLISEQKHTVIKELLSDTRSMPAQARIDLVFDDAMGQERLAQMILLPMQDSYGRTTRTLGCLDYDTTLGPISKAVKLTPVGSIVRPIKNQQGDIIRRMRHSGLRLITENNHPTKSPSAQVRPNLTLVEG